MKVLDYEWRVPKVTEWVKLWFLGDQHVGASGSAVGHLKSTIEEIKSDPLSRVALMGDCCDFVNMSDKRFSLNQVAEGFREHLDDLARKQAETFVSIHEPIKDQIMCLIPGNHDDKIVEKYHYHVAAVIAADLGVPLLHTISQVRLRIVDVHRSYVVKGVISHAKKGSTTLGGKVSAVDRMKKALGDHDFFAQAHTHQLAALPVSTLDVAGDFGDPRTIDRIHWVFLTGGYLRTYAEFGSGYGEQRGYDPTVLGSPYLKMRMKRSSKPESRQSVDGVEFKGVLS